MSPEPRAIADPHSVPETFITEVIDIALVSGCSIVVSLGVRRIVRPNFSVEPQETVVVNSRLALTLDAARKSSWNGLSDAGQSEGAEHTATSR